MSIYGFSPYDPYYSTRPQLPPIPPETFVTQITIVLPDCTHKKLGATAFAKDSVFDLGSKVKLDPNYKSDSLMQRILGMSADMLDQEFEIVRMEGTKGFCGVDCSCCKA